MAFGDHIRVRRARGLYWHHGIDAGEGRVIHFSGEPLRMKDAIVCEVALTEFLQGEQPEIVDSIGETRTPEETVRIARSLIGQRRYDLLLNNCEHFACYCKSGRRFSHQVAKAVAAAGIAVAGAAATGGIFLARAYVRGRARHTA